MHFSVSSEIRAEPNCGATQNWVDQHTGITEENRRIINSTVNPPGPAKQSAILQPQQTTANIFLAQDRCAELQRPLEPSTVRQAAPVVFSEPGRQISQQFGDRDAHAAENVTDEAPANTVRFTPTLPRPPAATGANQNYPSVCNSQGQGRFDTTHFVARQVIKTELPSFSGKPEEWVHFISIYEGSSRSCGLSDSENLSRLQRCLKGRAYDSVKYLLLVPETVNEAINTLRSLYGRPEVMIHTIMAQIRNLAAPNADKFQTIIDYALHVRNLVTMMSVTGLNECAQNYGLLQELVDKLPTNIKVMWARTAHEQVSVDLNVFSKWLFDLAMSLNKVTIPASDTKTSSRTQKDKNFVNAHKEELQPSDEHTTSKSTTKTQTRSKETKCDICQKDHAVPDCPVFLKMDEKARWEKVLQKKLCKKCFGKHFFRYCRQRKPCGKDGCENWHHPLMHRKLPTTETTPAADCNTHQDASRTVLHRIIPVKLYGQGAVVVETFAYLDDGSALTLMEDGLATELDLDGVKSDLCLRWTSDTRRVETNSRNVSMQISGIGEDAQIYSISNVRTVSKLSLPSQTITEADIQRYSHTQNIPVSVYNEAIPRLLIGLDNSKLVCPLKNMDGGWDEPVVTKTRLGWTFHGCNGGQEQLNDIGSIQFVHLNIQACDCTRDDQVSQQVRQYFALESLGVNKPRQMPESAREKRERELLEHTTKFVDGRYETGLLWRVDDPKMPSSYSMALRRFECLEKKMLNEPILHTQIHELLMEYVRKGYAKKLSPSEIVHSTTKTWYLPIFTVRNPNKPNKFRVVWDAAARVGGVSLNSMLMSGPDQLASLLGVLYRFREGRFGVSGDIKEMFHQVKIAPNDQQAQRFLWRDDPKAQIDHYAMQVMTFGATCSPSSAQFVKNQNAQRFKEGYPRAVDSIVRNHYVDDMLDSTDTEAEAVQLAQEVRTIHKAGGFEIRGWLSNSKRVLQSIEDNYKTADGLEIDPESEIDKVLGMWWCTKTDTFRFSLKYNRMERILKNESRPTKREVLKTVMSIFDPLGLISFYIINARVILRDIWRSSLDWDDLISDSQFDRWLVWIRLLPSVQKITIQRCYSTHTQSHITSRQLHVFVDASEDAYSAVAFVRVETTNGVECSLIGSKARVVPQQPLTIPRAELQAAVMGTRLANTICNEHRIEFQSRFLWSDSKTVLCWLRADCRKYKPFVAFRIGEILENTELSEWRWVPTKLNVADDATKWHNGSPDLDNSSRWFKGPEFLRLDQEFWPKSNERNSDTSHSEEELRPKHAHVNVHNSTTEPDTWSKMATRCSKWQRLHRTFAYVLRYISNLQRKVKKQTLQLGSIQKEELVSAENLLFRLAQTDEYMQEISDLTNGKGCVSKSSHVYKSSPYSDECGLLRVNGRTANANINNDAKRPILMPRKHPITHLLVTWYHERYHHLNSETVVNEIRQRFDIPRLRVLVKLVRNTCQSCKNERAVPRNPEQGDLPKCRVTSHVRPFTYVGVDYFGPMTVVVGRRVEKRYGVLFTCMTVRAIHLEVAHSLNTDSCIMCIRNFEARRGHPTEYFSDNGTNFHGADNELRAEWTKIKKGKIEECMNNTFTKWSFIPPSSPHMGGVWERLVRSVKTVLMKCMPDRNPTDELLRSFLMEVEMIINSRPLTYVPLDSAEDEALTPNHFLIGSSSGIKDIAEVVSDDRFLRKHWRTWRFWNRWVLEYLPIITKRSKWFEKTEPIKEGDVVILVDEKNPRNSWPKGIVMETTMGSNGQVRSALVRTDTGTYTRPVAKLAILDVRQRCVEH